MLGEQIGAFKGKVIGTRVVPCQGRGPGMEVTIQESGKLLGVEITSTGTYTAHAQGNAYHGEGQGLCSTQDGQTLTWKAVGTGRPTGKGQAASWRGALFFWTESQKLSRLNGTCLVFEHDCDENGTTTSKMTEWR